MPTSDHATYYNDPELGTIDVVATINGEGEVIAIRNAAPGSPDFLDIADMVEIERIELDIWRKAMRMRHAKAN